MAKAVDDYRPSIEALGELVGSLERHFDLLTSRSASLQRSFYDFWNAGEVICVASVEDGKAASPQDWSAINQSLLPSLRAAIQKQLETTE
jgi:hypothetical protein